MNILDCCFKIMSIILLVALPFLVQAQINQELHQICKELTLLRDTSDRNFSHLSRSREYHIELAEDTLIIEELSIDSLLVSSDPRDRRKEKTTYKMNINDIKAINFVSIKHNEYFEWIETYIEFVALRFYPLFIRSIEERRGDFSYNTDLVKVKVVNQKDTIQFKEIVNLLSKHIDLESNYIAPSCDFEDILLDEKNNVKIEAIGSFNLEKPIELNGSIDFERKLTDILLPYLETENIKKLFGTIILNKEDKVEYFYSEQNEMFNHLNSLDIIPPSMALMAKMAFFKITDIQKSDIEKLLKKQTWKTGLCNKKKVNSYLDFFITNSNYIEAKGKN